jgi:ankyrin repeat protein
VVRLVISGLPPYFVQVPRFAITEPDFSELKAAVESEDVEKIRALVARYGNVNQRELPSQQTALAVAAAGRHDASLQMLLVLGADANSADQIGVTPIMNAVVAGDVTAARALIASGANVIVTNKAGQSAALLAQEFRRDQILRLLVSRQQRQ